MNARKLFTSLSYLSGRSSAKIKNAITHAKYESQIEMANKKIEYDKELDDLKKVAGTDSEKLIDEIEREIHLEN